jgi:hypothetical protein
MPKSAVTYRNPRRLSLERKKEISEQMKPINKRIYDEKMLDNIRK